MQVWLVGVFKDIDFLRGCQGILLRFDFNVFLDRLRHFLKEYLKGLVEKSNEKRAKKT
jgi:hypothetical protein